MAGVNLIRAESAHAFGRHTHDQFGLGIVECGAQRSASGRGPVEAKAGDLITVNPGEVHDGVPLGGPRGWRMLYLDPPVIAAAALDVTEGAITDYEFAVPVLGNPAAAASLLHLFDAATAAIGNGMAFDEGLVALVARLSPQPIKERAGAAPAAIRLARMMIDDDPGRSITLQEIAAQTGLSRFQLVRGFAKSVGLTPHAYLIQKRIAKARQMMAAGHGLAETAAAAGFSDQSHMNRLFRRNFGISPGQYAGARR